MLHALEMTIEHWVDLLAELNQPGYRAKQLWQWVWQKRVADGSEMTNLPKALREALAERVALRSAAVEARSDSDDGVSKLLLRLADGESVECVLIPAEGRTTACISTQVGCNIGCAFCASGSDGLVRNLSAGEIIEQIFHLERVAGRRISHAVVMGMGEPLANLPASLSAVEAMIDNDRLGLSARHVTLSTVGLDGPLQRLVDQHLPINLAISLHAPSDELRRTLIGPGAMKIADLLAQARRHFDNTGREVTLEYVLLDSVNDRPEHARQLAQLARSIRCNVNLIRYNPTGALRFHRPEESAVIRFRDELARAGVNVQIRASRGAARDAACGQLRRQQPRHQEM